MSVQCDGVALRMGLAGRTVAHMSAPPLWEGSYSALGVGAYSALGVGAYSALGVGSESRKSSAL
eukprot:scaffold102653_cov54-Phaeocystis_antarctica.AAC.1